MLPELLTQIIMATEILHNNDIPTIFYYAPVIFKKGYLPDKC